VKGGRKQASNSVCSWSGSGARTIKLAVLKIPSYYFCALAAMVSPGPVLSRRDLTCAASQGAEVDAPQSASALLHHRNHSPWSSSESLAVSEQKYPLFCRISSKLSTDERQG